MVVIGYKNIYGLQLPHKHVFGADTIIHGLYMIIPGPYACAQTWPHIAYVGHLIMIRYKPYTYVWMMYDNIERTYDSTCSLDDRIWSIYDHTWTVHDNIRTIYL